MNPLSLLGPERRFFLLGLVGSLGLALSLPLLPPLVVEPLYAQVLAGRRYEAAPGLLLRAVGLVGLGALGLYLQDALFGVGAARFGSRARAAAYAALLRAKPGGSGAGRAARIALDVRELELFYAHDLTVVAAQGLTALAAVGVLLEQNARLTLLLGLVLVPLTLGLGWLGRRVEGAFRDAQAAAERGTGLMGEGLGRLEVIKAFRLERAALERFSRHNLAQDRATARRARLFALQAPLSQLATALGLGALLALSVLEVRANRLDAASLSAYLAGLGILLGPIQMLAKVLGKWAAMREPARALREALASPPEPDLGTLDSPRGGWRGEVVLERVVARYPGTASSGGEPALNGLSLRLRPGEAVALVGPSGGGKTSVVRVLLRLLEPESGRVTLDGHPIADYKLAAARTAWALVPQSPGLFAGTVLENLLMAVPNATPARVWAALEAAGLAEEVRAMPRGLETEIGDDGAGLSGGQAQRLAIARALLTEAPVLILDEPTSALDAHSEALVRRTLEGLRGRRTVLVIAHRLSTVEAVDRIVVVERGRVVEEGPHRALVRAGGRYAALLAAGHP